MTSQPSITVLIPTFNRRRALEAVWPSYLVHPDVARIVVVDDGSTDGTPEMLAELSRGTSIPVTVIRHENQRGQPASRLTAIQEATTEWVLFGEDDVWLSNDYCATLLKEARQLRASAIAGRMIPALVSRQLSKDLLVDTSPAERDPTTVFDLKNMTADFGARIAAPMLAPFLHSIALIQRSIFARVSFDTWYAGNSWREETDFYLTASAAGERVFFSPSTVCYHLRGPFSATGGQRLNRLVYEYYAWRNTKYLVSKHWEHLRKAHGFRGGVMPWMVAFYVRRQLDQLRRAATRGLRSSFRG